MIIPFQYWDHTTKENYALLDVTLPCSKRLYGEYLPLLHNPFSGSRASFFKKQTYAAIKAFYYFSMLHTRERSCCFVYKGFQPLAV